MFVVNGVDTTVMSMIVGNITYGVCTQSVVYQSVGDQLGCLLADRRQITSGNPTTFLTRTRALDVLFFEPFKSSSKFKHILLSP